MASRIPLAKESPHRGERRPHQGGSSLWNNQEEMKRYVSKLKSELEEQKSRVRKVHRDKAEEIKRLQENLDYEKQKAIENVSKKLESDKAYELKKMRESVTRQKEVELRQVLRVRDEEMRALKQELLECKNTARILESENKRITSEQTRSERNEHERRLKNEVSSLRSDKRRLEENLRIKSEADFEKAELIRKMKQEHDSEIRRLNKESKRESLKEFRHLKAVSREVELKNHQLAAKEAEMRRLAQERNNLGHELTSQRIGNLKKSNSFSSQTSKGLSPSHNVESDLDNVAEEKIKRLKLRNTELVAIARKLEEKAKQLQEEKDILEKSHEVKNPEVGNLKKAFAKQRARDLAERAKLLLNKDNEINNLKKEVEETRHTGFAGKGNAEELVKLVEQISKEHLLLEKQAALKAQRSLQEIEDITAQNSKLSNDNAILKEQIFKLEIFKCEHRKIVSEIKETRELNVRLENACSEKDKLLHELEAEKQEYTAKNEELQNRNNELLLKEEQLDKVEYECSELKDIVKTLRNENQLIQEDNAKLKREIENLLEFKKDVEKLREEKINLEKEAQNARWKLEQRDNEIASLHKAQEAAQKKHLEDVSGLKEMLHRLEKQQSIATGDPSVSSTVLTSTPKNSKCTQTSRPTSPVVSPIMHSEMEHLQQNGSQQEDDESFISEDQDFLAVPAYNGTSSSASFDLEKAGKRIDQLAASDLDEVDCDSTRSSPKEGSSVSSELSEYSEEGNVESETETSYSADVSQTSDVPDKNEGTGDNADLEEKCDVTDENDEFSDDEDSRGDPGVFFGNPLQDLPDLEEKLSIYIAKYNYDPMLYSPNENPETELAFQAGDYLYVYGEVDDDGFYVGELMNGERGLVPSNFVERIAVEKDEAILKESDETGFNDGSDEGSSDEEIILKDEDGKRKVIRPKAFSVRRHEMFRSSLGHALTEQLDDIRESEEDDLGTSSLSEDALDGRKNGIDRSNKPEADQVLSEDFDSMDSDPPAPRIPSPTKLSLDRQFKNSALISWRGAALPNEEIQGYNVYVDGECRAHVKGCKKTNIVLEDIRPTETHRLSVRTKSVNGGESTDQEATMVFGPDAILAPSDLRVLKVTATSCEIQWLPAHSSYFHEVVLDETTVECVKPGCFSYTLNHLTPATLYQVQVRTRIPDYMKISMGNVIEESVTASIEFTTADGGLPEPPVDLRIAQLTQDHVILTWLPVTLSQNAFSNGYIVSSYKLYVNGIYCTETASACVDSVSVSTERLENLGRKHDFSSMRFVVRTLSVLGESADSNVVDISSDDLRTLTDTGVTGRPDFACEPERTGSQSIAAIKDVQGNFRDSENEVCLPDNSDNTIKNTEYCTTNNTNGHGQLGSVHDSTSETVGEPLESVVKQSESLGKLWENVGNRSEPDLNPTCTDEALFEKEEKGLSEKTDEVEDVASSVPDVFTTVPRRQPIVTRYEDGETESESTETRTEDTEEELIERFVQVEINQEQELNDDNVRKYQGELDGNDHYSAIEVQSRTAKTNTNEHVEHIVSEQKGQGDSEQHSSERSVTEEFSCSSTSSEHANIDSLPVADVLNANYDGEAKTRNEDELKTDSSQETGILRITEHYSESNNESDIPGEVSFTEQFQTLVQNAATDPTNELQTQTLLNKELLLSDSEVETEYGPLLSVIHEVDEDNLTESNSPSSQRSRGASNQSDATLSNNQINSLPIDSVKSSDLSSSRNRTSMSEDEGFRTEDDVLDLLDEDESLVGITGVARGEAMTTSKMNEGNSVGIENSNNIVRNDQDIVGTSVGNYNDNCTVSVDTREHSGLSTDNARVLEGTGGEQHYSSGSRDKNSSDCAGQDETIGGNLLQQDEDNSCTTDDESTESPTSSSCPSRNSLKSDSSISDAPPSAACALETIVSALSLPSNHERASPVVGDRNGNVVSEMSSEPVSEGGSEISEQLPEQVRFFVALYSYDPSLMSPNVNGADEELPFNEGDIIKVFGDKDADEFFWGECKQKQGFVPSNMISEIDVNEAEDWFNDSNDVVLQNQLNSRDHANGELDVDVISENLGPAQPGTNNRLSYWENLTKGDFRPTKMKALYDYDPARDSPNVDSEVELSFKKGEVIFVYGEMDDDGFYQGELSGIRGLVPSNFLKFLESEAHPECVPEENKQNADSASNFGSSTQFHSTASSNKVTSRQTTENSDHLKKRTNIFSKGRKMFKKAFK